jgi:ATP-binding cassette subfamily B protein/subfamily B ATP-binding cassette protein MsbA
MKLDTTTGKIFWNFLKPYKIYLVLLFFIGIILASLDLINIALLYPILAISTNQTYHPDNLIYNFIFNLNSLCSTIFQIQDPLITSCVLFIVFALLSFLFGVIYTIISLKITTKITTENKKKIFSKQIAADYQYFIDHKQGDIIYKTAQAPSFIAEVFNNFAKLSVDVLLSISTVLLLVSISLKGSILVLCASVLYYTFTRYLSMNVSYLTGTGRYQASQRENVLLNEYITGVKQIKVYEVSTHWKRQFEDAIDRYWTLWRKDSFWLQVPVLLLYLLIFVTIGVVVIVIKLFYPFDFITYIPILGTFSLAILKLLPRLANFGNYQMGIMSALPNLKIVEELLEDTTYKMDNSGKIPFEMKKPDIVFDHITFGHKNREIIFEDLSLHIEAGKTTAIVGTSGSGKSTLIDLILRLYDIQKGAIFIDEINIKDYDLVSLRNKIGFVSQETFIFNASISENISFGQEFSESVIIEAAKLANAHEFIQQLPQQYETIVGDRGVKLSGGERQRIAIARAIIRKPELLILDEATSSLDNVTEKVVQDAINNVAKKCTTIIVAHRLSTVKDAEIIYVLENGRIVETGTHDDLMLNKGKYWEMYTRQVE